MKHIKTYEGIEYQKHLKNLENFKIGGYIIFNNYVFRDDKNNDDETIIIKNKPYKITSEPTKLLTSNEHKTLLRVENGQDITIYSAMKLIEKVVSEEEGKILLDTYNMNKNVKRYNI